MIRFSEYTDSYQDKVVQHIVEILNDEFHLNLFNEELPDLISIKKNYQEGGGNFWIAINETGEVIGTIGLFNLGNNAADLRRMFVKPAYRGKEKGVSKKLLDLLLIFAKDKGFKKIYLESTSVFKAAARFYSKNGFEKVDRTELPDNFPVVRVAEYFFVRELE